MGQELPPTPAPADYGLEGESTTDPTNTSIDTTGESVHANPTTLDVSPQTFYAAPEDARILVTLRSNPNSVMIMKRQDCLEFLERNANINYVFRQDQESGQLKISIRTDGDIEHLIIHGHWPKLSIDISGNYNIWALSDTNANKRQGWHIIDSGTIMNPKMQAGDYSPYWNESEV